MTAHARSTPVRLAMVLVAALAMVFAGLATAVPSHAAVDYTQGVTSLGATQAKVWFTPTVAASLVDVHYKINGGGQQNFRMTKNGATWEQTIAISAGNVLDYWFTYEKGGPLFDTPHFTYTHAGGGGGGGGGDFTQGVTSLNATQAKIWFTPTTPASLVDVHYLLNGGGQQNFRMTKVGSTWEQTVSSLSTGSTLEYWFTYEKGGPLFDTGHFTYTHGGGGGGTTVATPSFNPPGGSYTSAQTVTITTATAGATIRYTIDGSTPTASSPVYGGPISVPTTRTLKAIGIKSGMTTSAVGTAAYTIGGGGGGGTGSFPITFQNNTRGTYTNAQIYVMFLGQVVDGQWSYMKPDGTMTHINHLDANAPGHLTKNGVNYANMSISLAQASTLPSPPRIRGGRIYISLGSPLFIPISPDDQGWGGPDLRNSADPNNDVYYDWYEYTYLYNEVAYGGNTTQVDQFGFPMTSRLVQTSSGYDNTLGITLTRAQVMSQYAAAVGTPFKALQNTYRIVAPRSSNAFLAGGAQQNYMQAYIDQTWAYYTANQFTLTRLGETFTGRVSGTTLTFTKNGAGPYRLNKPTSPDVLACAGALAPPTNDQERQLGAEFCAAFNRGVALNTANWYNPAAYYAGGGIKNDYAAFFHPISINNRSYAFPYDDINDQSSVQILSNSSPPTSLTIGIGW